MKTDNTTKTLLRIRNIQLCKAAVKLPNFWWATGTAVLSIVFLTSSFFVRRCCEWLCNVLISAGCGCITGLVFYFLSNIRNNKMVKLQKEYDVLNSTLDIMWKIHGYGSYYRSPMMRSAWKSNALEDGCEVHNLLDELLTERRKIPLNVYNVVSSLGFDPLDEDNMRKYKGSIDAANSESEMERCLIKIAKELMPAMDEITLLLWARRDQLMIMGRHFI